MKINPIFKLRSIAGENLVVLIGKTHADMSRVIALNESSTLMWNELYEKDFSLEDARQVLLDNYDVDESIALADAQKWVDMLREQGIFLSEE